MAKRLAIPSKEVKLSVVNRLGSVDLSRVQRLNVDANVSSTDVDELGNNLHAGTVNDIPEITVTFSGFDVGIRIFAALTGTDPDAYPGAGVDIANLGEIDAIFYIKSATATDYVKSGHGKKLQIRDFTFNYSIDGESTEEYVAIGSQRRWFKNDIVVDTFESGTTSFTLSETPIQLKNGDYLLSVILDGDYLTEVSAGPSTGEYSVSGTTLTTGDSRVSQAVAVYHANPAGDNWSYISDSVQAVAVRGQDVDILIGANDILRVQSVSINGNLKPEAVKELGNRSIVGYQSQVPTVEGQITVLDTDTELIELLTTGSIDGGDTEFEIGKGCAISGVSLEIKLIDPCDVEAPYTVLKTIYIPNISVQGDSFVANVNSNITQTFNYKSNDAQCIIYSGARA